MSTGRPARRSRDHIFGPLATSRSRISEQGLAAYLLLDGLNGGPFATGKTCVGGNDGKAQREPRDKLQRLGIRRGAPAPDSASARHTNDLLVSQVLRTNELETWFVAEHLVDVPLVRADQAKGAGT
jgi:hypothetical protein